MGRRARRRPGEPAILAQPPGSVAGRFKVTEQGEVIAARYGPFPWVFAWTRGQPAGLVRVGTGLAAAGDTSALRAAYRAWPLVAAIGDNAEMSDGA